MSLDPKSFYQNDKNIGLQYDPFFDTIDIAIVSPKVKKLICQQEIYFLADFEFEICQEASWRVAVKKNQVCWRDQRAVLVQEKAGVGQVQQRPRRSQSLDAD